MYRESRVSTMKYNNKLKIYRIILRIFNSNIFYYILILLLIYFLYGAIIVDTFDFNNLLDVSLLTSIFLTFVATTLSKRLASVFDRKLEDHSKLNTNYSAMISKYSRCKLISYENSDDSNFVKGRKHTGCKKEDQKKEDEKEKEGKEDNNRDKYIFPVVLEKLCNNYEFDIVDSLNQYVLPDMAKDNYDYIMEAHKHSTVYNQLNIRLDDYHIEDNKITLLTSRTTYFYSLVTNRAMDYRWSSNNSIRELYSPGPFLEKLSESKLSNHLGFNGLVETENGKIIFIHRSKKVSIGKDTIGTSIGASLKAKYALNDEGYLTLDGLKQAITSEIKDELNIASTDYDFSLDKNIVAIYRDIVEGGKPQLLFYVKIKLSSDKVQRMFYDSLEKPRKSKDNLLKDGNKLILVDKEKLANIYITPETMVIGNKVYRTMPSTAASVVLIIKHLYESSN